MPGGTTNMSQPNVDERIIAHLGFARAVASRAIDPRCRGADREDLIADGVLGLVQAARRYRGDRGASFGAYAARRVRGQILDALRERDPLTRSARRAFRDLLRRGLVLDHDFQIPNPFAELRRELVESVAHEAREARTPQIGHDRTVKVRPRRLGARG